jgi:signal transduction histidine kinase
MYMVQKDIKKEGLEEKRRELLGSLPCSHKQPMIAGEELKKVNQPETESGEKISHECRTLLNIVLGFTELMLDEVVGEINEEQRSSLTEILNSTHRLVQVIDTRVDQSAQKFFKEE